MLAGLFLLPGFTFVLELIAFLLVLGFVAKYVLPPLRKAMDERAAHIRNSIQAAEDARSAAEEAVAKRRELLEQARGEARAIVDQANTTAEQLREEGRQRGQEEYERLLANAHTDIEQERLRARDEVMEDVGALVLRAAEQVIGGALDPAHHRALVDEAISAAQASAPGGSGSSTPGRR
ncbi:MAG: F0F1 ATP synthase subunit B [Acidimicrobiales bacterium]|jgi:F-type H+-transporting ATPase subunit b